MLVCGFFRFAKGALEPWRYSGYLVYLVPRKSYRIPRTSKVHTHIQVHAHAHTMGFGRAQQLGGEERHKDTKSQRHKVPEIQSHQERHKDTKSQRHKDTKAQRHKDRKTQRLKDTKPQRHKDRKTRRHKATKPQSPSLIVWGCSVWGCSDEVFCVPRVPRTSFNEVHEVCAPLFQMQAPRAEAEMD